MKGTWANVGSVVLLAALFGLAYGSGDSGSHVPPPPSLNADVRFSGTQFVIKNNDTFRWSNCELEVNPKTFSSGFTYQAGSLEPGTVYTVGGLQFGNKEGLRFNHLAYKPTAFSIA